MTAQWESLTKSAERAFQQGNLAEAEASWLAALEETRDFAHDDPRTAFTVDCLAEVTAKEGKSVLSELFYKQAVHLRTQALGPDHLAVAASLNNLAKFYYTQQKYTSAEPLAIRFIQIYEKALGETHPDVATGLHNLATLYHMQGKHREAEPAYRRALYIRQKALGDDHPDTQKLMKNLGSLMQTSKRAEAQEPKRRTIGLISGSWKALPPPPEGLLTREPDTRQS
jgi:tetratricopeptide (TPR) repeat protein